MYIYIYIHISIYLYIEHQACKERGLVDCEMGDWQQWSDCTRSSY